jgi:glycosyltransferase involved in cell wall biosynthesis
MKDNTAMTKNTINELSVVIPAYNAAKWLPKTIPVTEKALKKTNIKKLEFLIIDDGSTDNTAEAARTIKSKIPIRVITQDNGGRFKARDTGAKNAKYENLLFIDTRIFIGEEALHYLESSVDLDDPNGCVWNSHVYINKDNIYARFWEAIAFNAWRKYFINPRKISYGIKDFDKYPKGTTCFFIPKKIILKANKWFLTQTKDVKISNDDTLLIRGIAKYHNINVSPDFHCFYNSRSSLRQYMKHVFHRGKVFVDGFLRNDGNFYFYPLIGFIVITAVIPVLLAILPSLLTYFAAVGAGLWFMVLFLMLLRKTGLKDSLSFFTLLPIFVVFYGSGIWVAFVKIHIINKFK